MLFLCVHHRGLSHQPTTKRASRPHLLVDSTKPTSSHTTQNMRSENSSQQPCKSNLLPLISSTSICAQNRSTTECSKRDTVDKTKQRHLKQQSRPLHHVPTLHNDKTSVSTREENVALALMCSGYHTTKAARPDRSGASPNSSSLPNRKPRIGSIVAKSGKRGSHNVCYKVGPNFCLYSWVFYCTSEL